MEESLDYKGIIMEGVTEYREDYEVLLRRARGIYKYGVSEEQQLGHGRWVVATFNEGYNNLTEVDLLQLLSWLRSDRPDLLLIRGEVVLVRACPHCGKPLN